MNLVQTPIKKILLILLFFQLFSNLGDVFSQAFIYYLNNEILRGNKMDFNGENADQIFMGNNNINMNNSRNSGDSVIGLSFQEETVELGNTPRVEDSTVAEWENFIPIKINLESDLLFPKVNQLAEEIDNFDLEAADSFSIMNPDYLSTITSKLKDFANSSEFSKDIDLIANGSWHLDETRTLLRDIDNVETLPDIRVLPFRNLQARGAFGDDTIYLSQEFLEQNLDNPQQVADIIFEEIGHYLDSKLSQKDAPGDEGAIFASLVQNQHLGTAELHSLKQEDDHATLNVEGQVISVEQAANADDVQDTGIVLYRVNAGGAEIAALDGDLAWSADTAASNNQYLVEAGSNKTASFAVEPGTTVADTTPAAIFNTERWDGTAAPEMSWEFPVATDGFYEVRLFMGNGWSGTSNPGERVFDVAIEGNVLDTLNDIDLSDQFGHLVGGMISNTVEVSDGILDIDVLHDVIQNPLINGIEIIELTDEETPTPEVNLSVSPSTGSETDSTEITVTATASGAVSGDQTVDLSLSGSGVTPSDFTGTIPTQLTIADGQTQESFTVNVNNDTEIEGDETATLTLSNPSSGLALGTTPSGEVLISDSETFINASVVDEIGMVAVTDFKGVDSTGKTDSTAGIQEAIEFAIVNKKTLFFPSGTYLVSKTINAEQLPKKCGFHDGTGVAVMIGSMSGERPTIQLMDNAPGFDDEKDPTPVVKIFHPDGKVNCLFGHGFRGINIDLGQNNNGAVGISFDAAQESFLEDVTIFARDGFAGATGIPGRGSASGNITVVGGQYGFYLKNTSLGSSLVGVKLVGQEKNAIWTNVYRGLQISGFLFSDQTGSAIQVRGKSAQAGYIGLTDGIVQFKEPGVLINHNQEKSFSLTNVYIENGTSFSNTTGSSELSGIGWDHVKSFVSSPSDIGEGVPSSALIDGQKNSLNLTSNIANNVEAPSLELYRENLWQRNPSFEDKTSVLATEFGATPNDGIDDTKALQKAIDTVDHVYLPAGEYHVSQPLVLKANTIFQGVPGYRSALIVRAEDWNPSARTWIIDTVNAPDGKAIIMDITGDTADDSRVGMLRWRIGKDSIVRRIKAQQDAGRHELAGPIYQISGSGGGSWYSWTDQYNISKGTDPEKGHQRLLIRGTSQPLSIYGLNPERGGGNEGRSEIQYPFVKIENSKNIRILGSKIEAEATPFLIENSSNIFIGTAFTNKSNPESDYLILKDVNNIDIRGLYWPGTTGKLIRNSSESITLFRTDFLGIYSLGSYDFSVFFR
ncbi:MAG: hypothetical protein GVY04_20135 [Cyanobacteria bacterium]|jgi:hypothetical protein|nr:hypothetical protein [Cyanobacteria bacterium GSL.Bin1]